MNDIQLVLNEQQELEFDIDIEGISTSNVDVRLIVESENMNLRFDGTFKNNIAIINIPILSTIIKPGDYKSYMEIVIEGEKYFKPMEANISFVMPIKVSTKIKESKAVKRTSIIEDIKAPTVRVKRVKTINEKIVESLDELASSSNKEELLKIYNEKVVQEDDIKEAVTLINAVCTNEKGISFKEYITEIESKD